MQRLAKKESCTQTNLPEDLLEALNSGDLKVLYQPKVEFGSWGGGGRRGGIGAMATFTTRFGARRSLYRDGGTVRDNLSVGVLCAWPNILQAQALA